jgi:hypothetical protein
MKNKILIVSLTLALITTLAATGCTSSYATTDQVYGLQNQVNSLNSSLNSTQQQLASTQQQLQTTQQSLNVAQSRQQQNTYVTSAQPNVVYPPVVIYRSYSYGTPWHQSQPPVRSPQPAPPAPPFHPAP